MWIKSQATKGGVKISQSAIDKIIDYCYGDMTKINGEIEKFLAVGDQHRILAKPIHHHIDEAAVEAELYVHCVTLEHLEHSVGVLMECLTRQFRAGRSCFFA